MAFNEYLAIRYTPFFAKKVPWVNDINRVMSVLGFKGHFPAAKEFVNGVRNWQRTNRLVADGMLGPKTYRLMKPQIARQPANGQLLMGPDPEWVASIKQYEMPTSPAPSPPSSGPVVNAPQNDADRVIKEMVDITMKQKDNVYPAYEISSAYLADQMKMSTTKSMTTGITLVPTLEVGQKWNMKGGNRIVMTLNPSSPWSGGAEIIFITDSGKAYTQTLKGWAADAQAAFFSGLYDAMKPMKLLLDIEAYILLGAISASGFTGFAVVASTGATQWVLNNKEKFASWLRAIEAIYDARKFMKANTPVLYDKVFSKVLAKVLDAVGEIPDSALSDPKNLARLVGGVLYQAAKMVFLRDFKVGAEIFGYFLKVVMTAVRAIPGAISTTQAKTKDEAAKSMIEKLRTSGIAISMEESLKILGELSQHGDGAQRQFAALEEALSNVR